MTHLWNWLNECCPSPSVVLETNILLPVLTFVTYWATVLLLFILAQLQRRCYLKWNEMTFTLWHCFKQHYQFNALWPVTFGQLSNSCSTCSTMWCHLKRNDFTFSNCFKHLHHQFSLPALKYQKVNTISQQRSGPHNLSQRNSYYCSKKTFIFITRKYNKCNWIKHVYSKKLSQIKTKGNRIFLQQK